MFFFFWFSFSTNPTSRLLPKKNKQTTDFAPAKKSRSGKPREDKISFTVYDEDWGKSDDYLGSCTLRFEAPVRFFGSVFGGFWLEGRELKLMALFFLGEVFYGSWLFFVSFLSYGEDGTIYGTARNP